MCDVDVVYFAWYFYRLVLAGKQCVHLLVVLEDSKLVRSAARVTNEVHDGTGQRKISSNKVTHRLHC